MMTRTYVIDGRRYTRAGLMIALRTGALDANRVGPSVDRRADRELDRLLDRLEHAPAA